MQVLRYVLVDMMCFVSILKKTRFWSSTEVKEVNTSKNQIYETIYDVVGDDVGVRDGEFCDSRK